MGWQAVIAMPDLDTKNGDVRNVAVLATSPDRLMYGEDPENGSLEDAVHWIKAYSELLAFKDRLLLDMESGIKSLSVAAGREIRDLDLNLIEIQRKRYRSRLVFWEARRTNLVSKKKAAG